MKRKLKDQMTIDDFGLTKEIMRERVEKLVEKSIRIFQSFEPEDGYYLAFSGGKDSQTAFHLAKMSGVKFDAHYSVTSVDHPLLVRFIKTRYQEVAFDIPHDKDGKPITMWSLIRKHTIPPTRLARYCCSELKEANGKNRVTVTGVRWAESARRNGLHGIVDIRTQSKKLINGALETNEAASLNKRGGLILNDDNDESRRMVEHCYRTRKTIVNPIVDWEDEDVWFFLNEIAKVEHCELYDPPYNLTRLGCIGCPLQGSKGMLKDFEMYPKYKELYIRAFQRMIDAHPGDIKILELDDPTLNPIGGGVDSDNAREKVYRWWITFDQNSRLWSNRTR